MWSSPALRVLLERVLPWPVLWCSALTVGAALTLGASGCTDPGTGDPDGTPTASPDIELPVMEVSATMLEFGPVILGETALRDLIVSNSGNAELHLSAALSDDAGAQLTLQEPLGEVAVGPGLQVAVRVAFEPSSLGLQSGMLELTSNDEGSAKVDVSLSGEGVAPDEDGDGFDATGDCDDTSGLVYPGADEICDEADNDCDGSTDEDASDATSWYSDLDDDGYGAGEPTSACAAQAGTVATAGDCDDANPAFHPGADESDCADAHDYNCDGATAFDDRDADGSPACLDCDDTRGEVSPTAPEICDGLDNNCDGTVDEGLTTPLYADQDSDGHGNPVEVISSCSGSQPGYVGSSDDCNDSDPATYPGALERCDRTDNDCDVEVDEEAIDMQTWYPDGDSDGYGVEDGAQVACFAPEGLVGSSGDCNDADPAYNPGAVESNCSDPNDYNCDGSTAYGDADEDGFPACQDCNDQSAEMAPGRTEVCDGLDNNCDGQVDEGVTTSFYQDYDGDGHGDATQPTQACSAPAGYVSSADDCDDRSAGANPDASETCDERDTDCDGQIDETGAIGCTQLYADGDGDTYGGDQSVCSCDLLLGYTTRPGDCNDTSSQINPSAIERCNGTDDDCDAASDEENAQGCIRYYNDQDDDGWGTTVDYACLCQESGTYTSTANGDCNDIDGQTYPGNLEACDGKDNNCNGQLDEGVTTTFYLDNDGDGYGASYSTKEACSAPGGYVAAGGDCNDYNASISPGTSEACDTLDNNCNGIVDENLPQVTVYIDLDGDGHGAEGTSGKKSCLSDEDGDGVGESAPSGYSLASDDCDDSASVVYPGAAELCDGRLNNCNLDVADIQCPTLCSGSWPVFVGGSSGFPVIGQLDNDNQLEVVIQNEGTVRVLGHDGVPQWTAGASVSYSYPNLADLNYDGTLDVIVPQHGGTTNVYSGSTGAVLTTITTGTSAGYYGSLALDVDGDGATDLIPSGFEPYTLVLMNKDLTVKSQVSLAPLSGERFILNSPALFDFEGDGVAEILMGSGSWQCTGDTSTCRGRQYVFRSDGTYYNDPTWTDSSLPWFEVAGYPYSYAGEGVWMTVADADGDGAEDLSQYFHDRSGVTPSKSWIWDQDGEEHAVSGSAWNASFPILAPVGSDGRLDMSGALHHLGGPVFDLDGDGTYEVVGRNSSGVVVTSAGKTLDGYPIKLSAERPVVGDLNRDGRLDMLFLSSSNNSLNCYTMGEGTYGEQRVLNHGSVDGVGRNWYRTGRLDPFEPNDRRGIPFTPSASSAPVTDSRAFPLGPLRDTYASGGGWYRTIKGLIAEQDDVDYYVQYGSIIRVDLQPLVRDYDLYLHQYRTDGTYINTMSSLNSGAAAEGITCHSTSGCASTDISKILLIEVRGKDPTVDFGPFPYLLKTIWAN